MSTRFLLLAIFGMVMSCAADELLLRNQEKVTDIEVARFDPDGVVLSNGKRFGWDQISGGKVAKQQAFDKMLDQVGLPLFQLKIRLKKRDFENLGSPLQRLLPIFEHRKSDAAFQVYLAQLKFCSETRPHVAICSLFHLYRIAGSEEKLKQRQQRLEIAELVTGGYPTNLSLLEIDPKQLKAGLEKCAIGF